MYVRPTASYDDSALTERVDELDNTLTAQDGRITGLENPVLFEGFEEHDVVKHTVGEVTADTSVQSLRSGYDLDLVVADMLKIGPTQLTPSALNPTVTISTIPSELNITTSSNNNFVVRLVWDKGSYTTPNGAEVGTVYGDVLEAVATIRTASTDSSEGNVLLQLNETTDNIWEGTSTPEFMDHLTYWSIDLTVTYGEGASGEPGGTWQKNNTEYNHAPVKVTADPSSSSEVFTDTAHMITINDTQVIVELEYAGTNANGNQYSVLIPCASVHVVEQYEAFDSTYHVLGQWGDDFYAGDSRYREVKIHSSNTIPTSYRYTFSHTDSGNGPIDGYESEPAVYSTATFATDPNDTGTHTLIPKGYSSDANGTIIPYNHTGLHYNMYSWDYITETILTEDYQYYANLLWVQDANEPPDDSNIDMQYYNHMSDTHIS